MNVLLVEDDPAEARLTCEAFREAGIKHDLHHVSDGETATRYLRHEKEFAHSPLPNIVLLDLNLPGKHGREVLREMKADPLLQSIPVIVVSNSHAREDIDEVYRLHGNGYLIKPGDFEDFIQMVRSLADFWLRRAELPFMPA
jgi:two-component system, chemotaxis family, response regulator Rcp1